MSALEKIWTQLSRGIIVDNGDFSGTKLIGVGVTTPLLRRAHVETAKINGIDFINT